jgi:hypothetical protein
MATQNDLFQSREDQILAERLMQLPVSKNFQGMFRTSNQYVNSDRVAEVLSSEVGTRNIIEFCVTTLERRRGD